MEARKDAGQWQKVLMLFLLTALLAIVAIEARPLTAQQISTCQAIGCPNVQTRWKCNQYCYGGEHPGCQDCWEINVRDPF